MTWDYEDIMDDAREYAADCAMAAQREMGDCPHCSGTGEGSWDGGSCSACGGRGEL